MRRPTNITIACVVIITIIVICVFAFNVNKKPSTNTVKNEPTKNSNEITKNETKGNTENKVENTTTDEQSQNETENTVESEVQNVVETTETFTETPETEGEKAVSIVRKDWGEDSSVDISVERINPNGTYAVSVRSIETTEAYAFYTVDVGAGSFTKREMN